MVEPNPDIVTAPGQGFNTVANDSGPSGDTGAVPVTGGVYQGPGTYEPDGTYHPFDTVLNPDPNIPDNVDVPPTEVPPVQQTTPPPPPLPDPSPVPPPPAQDPATDAPGTGAFSLVGRPAVLNGENGAKSAALIIGGYDGADYVNLLVWDDPQSAGVAPSIFPRYLIQVEPGTEPGQFTEL